MRFRPYVRPSSAVYSSRTARALIVMPFSRSRSIESRTWLVIWRASMVCVSSSSRSASVDLPWSICAMIEKLRRRSWGMVTRRQCSGRGGYGPGRPTCSSDLQCREGRDTRDDHDDTDGLEAPEALAEEHECGYRGECGELATHHGRDRDALAGAPGAQHRTEDFAGSGDDDQGKRGPGEAQPTLEQQRDDDGDKADETRRERDPRHWQERRRLAVGDESDAEDKR